MICVSIARKGLEACLEAAKNCELAEIRLDLAELSVQETRELFSSGYKLLATCRPGKYSDEQRYELLVEAIKAGAAYVDIEYDSEPGFRQNMLDAVRFRSCKGILSYHDFQRTPSLWEMNEIIKDSFDLGADLVKLAVTTSTRADCALVLSLYQHHKNIIAFGMGTAGKISRIAAPFLGAEFTFAALSETELTAPGQLTKDDLETIYQRLNG